MPPVLSRVRPLLSRAVANFTLDGRLLRAPYLRRGERVRFIGAKYRALLTGKRSITWFSRPFAYDNLWTPALLQDYPHELARVIEASELPTAPRVLDVGANVGQFAATLFGARPNARIWSCEPNPAPLALLRENAANRPEWTVLPFGVGVADTDLDFFYVEGKSGQGSVHAENATLGLLGGEAVKVTVPIRQLSEARREEFGVPDAFDLVKVDVEGAERDALTGLAGITWRNLVIELSVGRAGAMTRDELLALCHELWGASVVIHRVLTANEHTEELVLRAGESAN